MVSTKMQSRQYDPSIIREHQTLTKDKQGAGIKETGHGTSMFDANKGTIGSAFHKEGTIGQIGEKIGGPLASDGMIGTLNMPTQR